MRDLTDEEKLRIYYARAEGGLVAGIKIIAELQIIEEWPVDLHGQRTFASLDQRGRNTISEIFRHVERELGY